MNIRIGYEFYSSAKVLDPAKITDIYQSNLIENFYSRILEYNTSGELVCVLCQKFWIEDKIIYFEFKPNLKTIDGLPITAIDAEKSFKRLIKKSTNTHGNLSSFIDVEDNSTITSLDNILKIKLLKSQYSQFLLPLLASMDFSVISSKAIDNEDKNGYLDLKNTTGPYYLLKDNDEGNLLLTSNKFHPLYSKEMPQQIQIVPVEYGEGVDQFLNNKIDVLDVTYYPGMPQYEKLFSQNIKKFNTHKTYPINVFMLNFTPQAINEFSQEQIFYVGKIISNAYLNFKKYGYGFKQNEEFFQFIGTGKLEARDLDKIKNLRLVKDKLVFHKPIVLGVLKSSYERVHKALESYSAIQVKPFDEDPSFLPLEKRPHAFIQTTDSSFNEDISLVSYNFSMGYFGYSSEESKIWVDKFINTPDRKDRIFQLKELHLQILEKGYIYPIGSSPYWAISNEELELNFSESFPGSTWWKIRKK
jgi:hypothetical protein